jgi:AraC family transcriptional regulator
MSSVRSSAVYYDDLHPARVFHMRSIPLQLISITSALLLSIVVASCSSQAAASSAPPGWEIKGDHHDLFEIGIDPSVTHDGKACAFIKSADEKTQGLGTLKQKISANHYLGKRLRLTVWLKTENVRDTAGLWMRVDAADHKMIQFDNMENRPIKGTTDWKQYSVVLDAPQNAETIHFGFLLSDTGKVWASDFHLDQVGKDIPSTNMVAKENKLPDEPVNLDFSKSK